MPRNFTDEPAKRCELPLLIGVAGFSGSGKTKSMLRLATGIQRVRDGDIFVIDTESNRAKMYADQYKFRHVPFVPPFGPDDYRAAIDHCVKKGARIIIVDSMSHEHDGDGGVLEQHEAYLDAKCGDDWNKRAALTQLAWQKPKAARKKLNNRILQLADVAFLFGYRAQDKMKMVKGDAPLQLGTQPITTSNLVYEMTLRVLLRPGADGVPTVKGDTPAENMLVKTIDAFRGWSELNQQLSEDLGEKLARFTAGDAAPAPGLRFAQKWGDKAWAGKPITDAPADVVARYIADIEKYKQPMPEGLTELFDDMVAAEMDRAKQNQNPAWGMEAPQP